jgi:hypothetical protein
MRQKINLMMTRGNMVFTLVLFLLSAIDSYGQDMFNVRQLTSYPAQEGFATWSPDGKSIVFQHTDLKDTLGKNGL